MRKTSLIVAAVLSLAFSSGSVLAMGPVLLKDYKTHSFDAAILSALGYDVGSVVYFREMASISDDQAAMRRQYEPVGCNPFYVMQNGVAAELGFDCKAFFCVGYVKGPKQCRLKDGSNFGGVVEINKRLGLVTINESHVPFTDYAEADRTQYMKDRITALAAIQCTPFYLQLFDVVVGEGFDCTEVGKYPNFSGKNTCVNDWRTTNGTVCDVPYREDEFDRRKNAIGTYGGTVSSSPRRGPAQSSSSSSLQGASSSSTPGSLSSSSASSVVTSFPDVIEGKYGYTAIMALAAQGIIKGYPDGTFQPWKTVNRAEFVSLLVNGLHPQEKKHESWCFPDVSTEWYGEAVCASKRLGWINGYRDGLFRAARTITKAEAMKIILSSLDEPLVTTAQLPVGVPDGAWYSPYVRKAVELKILLESSFDPTSEVTRADTAVWLFRAQKVQQSQ